MRLTVAFVLIAHGATTAQSEHGLGTFGDRVVVTAGDRTSEIMLLAVTILTSGFTTGTDHPDDEITGVSVHDVSSLIALCSLSTTKYSDTVSRPQPVSLY